MPETLKTEEERKNYIQDLNKIAQKRYGEDYHYLCADKKRLVKTLYQVGYLKVLKKIKNLK